MMTYSELFASYVCFGKRSPLLSSECGANCVDNTFRRMLRSTTLDLYAYMAAPSLIPLPVKYRNVRRIELRSLRHRPQGGGVVPGTTLPFVPEL